MNMIDNNAGGFLFLYFSLGLIVLIKLTEKFMIWFREPRNKFTFIISSSFIIGVSLIFAIFKLRKVSEKSRALKDVTSKSNASVYCGMSDENEEIWIRPEQRTMHTQVIGTTNAGKTESVVLPWAIKDIHDGRGLILIDGKADFSLLNKLWSYTVSLGREKDFRLFSLSRVDESFQFNPLIGGTAEEITERVFNAFEFDNPYYRDLQYEVMSQVMRVFQGSDTVATFPRLYQVISKPEILMQLSEKVEDELVVQWVMNFCALSSSEREKRVSGLLTALGQFTFGAHAKLFNPADSAITLDEVLKKNQIVYFQLPVLLSPFLGKATGKLVLQSLQAAIANRHRSGSKPPFFGVFLDDFTEYLTPNFVSLLNKSRSANVGVLFAHQALGDIKELGEATSNSILTNSNLKIFMRGNDPESAEYFSKVIGTKTSTKFTERQKIGRFSTTKTGEASARDVEVFDRSPNIFKRDLGVGEAVMVIPHARGAKNVRLKFVKIDDLPSIEIPKIEKRTLGLIEVKTKSVPATTNETPINHV